MLMIVLFLPATWHEYDIKVAVHDLRSALWVCVLALVSCVICALLFLYNSCI